MMTEVSMDEAVMSDFEIHDNILVANVDLCWENHEEFKRYCDELMQSDHEWVILDLSPVTFVFSTYMGTIGHLLTDAANQDKRLTIRIAQNLSWLFEMVGFEQIVDIEVMP